MSGLFFGFFIVRRLTSAFIHCATSDISLKDGRPLIFFVFQIVNLRICLLAFAYTLILSHQPRNVNTVMLKNAPFSEAFLLIS